MRNGRQSAFSALHHSSFIISLLIALSFVLATPAVELTDQQVIERLSVEQPRDLSIRKGLEYLRKQQSRDGAVGNNVKMAMTSLAVMAHLAAGVTPDDAEHGAWMRRGLLFVLGQQDENGYLGSQDGSRMYGHGIATLMLAEALGMTRDDDLEERLRVSLERAVAVTVNAAKVRKSGGHEAPFS